MRFDLSTLHLGDILMALPSMRAGDVVSARDRIPGAPVTWSDGHGLHPVRRQDEHMTDAWLRVTGREPVRHRLMPERDRDLLVIAPTVASQRKQWPYWRQLIKLLPRAVVLLACASRDHWMHVLNRAHTVVCPDTGTAHMADALGCRRVIALHGVPRNWPRCAPYWSRSYCIARDCMAAITVDDVMEKING